MSKKGENIENFIQLRIEGKSYSEISEILHISKPTLLEWSKDIEANDAIKLGRVIKHQALIVAYQQDRASKLETYCKVSQKIREELLNRDLTVISSEKLLTMLLGLERRIEELSTGEFTIKKSFDYPTFEDISIRVTD